MDSILTEEQVKHFVNEYYIGQGFRTTVAWGHSRGTDIIATKESETIIIEVKGCGSRTQMQGNYFQAILGEILQRMNEEQNKYCIALPKMKRYEDLWAKLPALAKERTQIVLIMVDQNGNLEFYK